MRLPRFQFGIMTILALTATVAACLAGAPYIRASVAVQSLSNDDLKLNLSTFGPIVFLEGDAANTLRELGSKANHQLVRSLRDRTKFAAAHHLLKEINAEKYFKYSHRWRNEMDPARNFSNFSDQMILDLEEFWSQTLDVP